jgi:hypothetical protein
MRATSSTPARHATSRRGLDLCDRIIGDALIGVMLILSFVLCLNAI